MMPGHSQCDNVVPVSWAKPEIKEEENLICEKMWKTG